ncbi:MAG: DUF255 domain-containing protein [Cocleimonas sp.]
MNKIITFLIFPLFLLAPQSWASESTKEKDLIEWQEWSSESFAKAKKENKLVIMDLEAVWCHWCHVMDAKTYHDPNVAALINKHFVPIRVDQDAHPDISNRYEDYGWPATVIFNADGTEIIKKRGYIGPKFMGWFLEAVIAEPNPEAHENKNIIINAGKDAFLSKEQKKLLNSRFEAIYDKNYKGWGRRQKFVHSDSIEYAMLRATKGSKLHEQMAKDTLDAARQLIDPEWGGVYQYSDEANWKSPHFEKVMLIQTDSLRLYALAFKLWGRVKDLESANQIYAYLINMLQSPQGSFYTSQDADLNAEIDGHEYFKLKNEKRRKLGIPRIDKNIYARENGWVINALISMHQATNEKKYLTQSISTADWILQNRSLKSGGFFHHKNNKESLYLADTLAMGQAFVSLYEMTKDMKWLDNALVSAAFIDKNFKDIKGGYSTREIKAKNLLLTPVKHINSQILMTRFANQLYRLTKNKQHRGMAEHAMRYLASSDITNQRRLLGGVLLSDMELTSD